MSSTLVVILFAIGAVGIFVLGMSLTLIFKGHNIKSEISDNEHMQERGLKCAIQEAREEDGSADDGCHGCSASSCTVCDEPHS